MSSARHPFGLYLVLDPDHARSDIVSTARAAIDGGVTCLQLRWKSGTDRQVVDLARALRDLTQSADIPLIVNDRLDIALAVGAAGVHLGVDDLPVADARRLGGAGFIVGYSPDTDADLAGAADAGATYLGIGPLFGTMTKVDAGPALGIREFARRRALTSLPVVAIGGITAHNAKAAFAAGADGIAVVSAIVGNPDPGGGARQLRQALPDHP